MSNLPPPVPAMILVVEDVFVGMFLRDALVRHGYQVVCAEPAGALKLLQQDAVAINLLITNAPAPFAQYSDLPLLYIAACPDPDLMRPFRCSVAMRKPFGASQLAVVVKQLIP